MDLEEKIKTLPNRPGVYIMRDRTGKVLYLGKAKNLSHRVRSYFGRSEDSRFLVRFFVSKIEDIECIVTDTEKEALILENNLIKKFKPRYNVDLKDDKTFFNLKLDVQNPFPKLTLVRRVRKDGARYFGPFSSSRAVKETINFIEKHFQLRKCAKGNFKNRSRPCLYFQMGQCQGACVGLVDEKRYRERVREAILFLERKNDQLIQILRRRMEKASRDLLFEESARLRDQIDSIEKTIEKQKVVSFKPVDQDVIAFHREGALVEVNVMYVRQGKLMEGQSFPLKSEELSDEEILSSFVTQFYSEGRLVPQEIILPLKIEECDAVAEWLTEQRGGKATVRVPKRGGRLDLLKMVEKNAEIAFEGKRTLERNLEATLGELKKGLRLNRIPRVIECFDVSNMLGTAATASMVVFRDGQPDKSKYRRFRIKTRSQPDDYGMMYEVLMRRYSKVPAGEQMPDLIMVDGGKGHLQVILEVFKDLNMKAGDAIALAKPRREERRLRRREKSGERVYVSRIKDPIHMPKHSTATFLLQKIRDESHRFAISYHKKLRKKRDLRSILDGIPGVGKVRKKQLLMRFNSLREIENASIEELRDTTTIDRGTAQRIHQFFHS
ncbi:MAG: excinuclease ABC subunit UvrC [Proteobacteria bacterium]|nr:excinuclease ABC subunit UvrC [Pseudomonadota bacterium]